jgi:SulP family sulfate permease
MKITAKDNQGERFTGDVTGAFAAAALTLPMSIGYSITAFAAFGSDFTPMAVVLGINAFVLSCLFTALFSGTPTLISGPSGPVAVVMISFVSALQAAFAPLITVRDPYSLIVVAAALCLIIAGLLQVLLGYFKIGSLTRYVPYPVVSGFMNGIALLLILHQLPTLLGIYKPFEISALTAAIDMVNPATLLTGGISFGCVIIASRYMRKFSPPLFGLLCGVAVHYATLGLFPGFEAGRVIGEVKFDLLRNSFIGVSLDALDVKKIGVVLPEILFFGMILCLISSIETMMSSAALSYRTSNRYDSNKDLMGQGIGNLMTTVASIMPSSGSLVRSIGNYRAGARTRRSGVISSVLIFIVFLVAHNYLGRIPLAVFAGIILSVAFSLFDRSELMLTAAAVRAGKFNREVGLNLLISFTVTLLTVVFDLTLAIFVGILITTANFVVKTGKSVVRRTYRCNQTHSKRVRNLAHTRLLKERGAKILVIELQGPIFFGSAEEVAKEIFTACDGARYIILNMKRVSEIDVTGMKYLLQIHNTLKMQSRALLLCHAWDTGKLWDAFSYTRAVERIGGNNFFPDIDGALEHAEDQVLCDGRCEILDRPYALEEMDIFAGFSKQEIAVVRNRLILESYKDGQPIVNEGEQDRDLFLLVRGMVSTKLQLSGQGRVHRLNAISAGVTFGEMSMLDHKPRSASVIADGQVEVYRLAYADFLDLQKKESAVINKLILNLAHNLSIRLRLNAEEIKFLTEN